MISNNNIKSAKVTKTLDDVLERKEDDIVSLFT